MRNTKAPSTPSGGLFIFIVWAVAVGVVGSFSLTSHPSANTRLLHRPHHLTLFASKNNVGSTTEVNEWKSLTDNGAVKMKVVSSSPDAAASETPPLNLKGKDVTVEYIGSITTRNWTAQDVIECWLPDQGLSSLAPELFEAFEIDDKRLTNPKKFGTKFIKEGLGILKDAKQTTLFEAAQELRRSEETYGDGTVFDKNQFTFRPGKGQVIRAFDLAVNEMKVGQTVSIVARCDFAYGSKGLRVGGRC